MSFFFSFFFQNTVRLFPKRHNTENETASYVLLRRKNSVNKVSTVYKQCKQNLRDFAKKVLVIKLDPLKDFDKSTRLVMESIYEETKLHFFVIGEISIGGEARLAKPMLQLRKTKKGFANFPRDFWRFPTKFQRFKK